MSRTDAWRRQVTSAITFHEAVAERLGINPTDARCLGLLADEGPMTPTRLAELADLTTGAITGVLDRLEATGFVRRAADPEDRRRMTVHLDPARAGEIAALYEPIAARAVELMAGWDPEAQQRLGEYLEDVACAMRDEAARLRVAARGGMLGDTYTAPLGEATRGRLVFTSGAPRLTFNAALLGQQVRMVAETAASRLSVAATARPEELIRARFTGPPPEIRAVDGVVTIRYKRRLLDTHSRAAEIALNPTIPWAFDIDGGLTDLDASLGEVRFTGLDVRGGANHVTLRLPRPEGTVHVAISGGASNVTFERPVGVGASLRVRGGVARLRFDDQRMASVGAELLLQSDGYARARNRYEFAISGGASDLAITAG